VAQERADLAGAGGAEGVADGDGAAVGVDLGGVEAELTDAVEALAGEGLVELDGVDLVDGEAGLVQELADGGDGADAHDVGGDARDDPGLEGAEGVEAERVGLLLGHQERHGGAVGERGGVPGGDGALGVEGGAEAGEALGGGVGADALVMLDGDGLGAGLGEDGGVDGDDLLGEDAFFAGDGGAAVGLGGEGVLVGAADLEARGDVLGGGAHGGVGLGAALHEVGVGGDLVAAHGDHGHGLDAAGDADVDGAQGDAVGDHADGLGAAGAEAVDGGGRDGVGEAGEEADEARGVHALLGLGHGDADEEVLDLFGLDLGVARQERLDDLRGHGVGAGVAQAALEGAAKGCAQDVDDGDFTGHGGSLCVSGVREAPAGEVRAGAGRWRCPGAST
jgi:hypothetical protein